MVEATAQPQTRADNSRYRRSSYAVWEVTLKCNLACRHCGSRAGDARVDELTTEEALNLVDQLAEVGIREVTLIGGEAFMRRDWLQIARAIVDRGMLCGVTTGGYGISLDMARQMKEAGICFVSVSVDGLAENHDAQRGRPGSWDWCFRSMANMQQVGLAFGCNTQVNRLSAPELPRLYEYIQAAGIRSWQFQLTNPMGHAADRPDWVLQPVELLYAFPLLARLAYRANAEGIRVLPGSNVGYYGPYEPIIRYQHLRMNQFWMGCQAGLNSIGIEANGNVKGDPSLPSEAYTGGNIRTMPLRDILQTPELRINAAAGSPEGTAHLWGFCKTCDFATLCRGGCSWTSHVFFGRRGNNVFCHHRAMAQARRGMRERVEQRRGADGKPFDHGIFEIIEEPLNAPWPEDDGLRFYPDKVVWPDSFAKWPVF
ncbi:MAG: radical SAM protein [Candidatus Competibacterales bacterium]